jgi:hypothetical protein
MAIVKPVRPTFLVQMTVSNQSPPFATPSLAPTALRVIPFATPPAPRPTATAGLTAVMPNYLLAGIVPTVINALALPTVVAVLPVHGSVDQIITVTLLAVIQLLLCPQLLLFLVVKLVLQTVTPTHVMAQTTKTA